MSVKQFCLLLIISICLWSGLQCETHCTIDENDETRISFIGDSPYLLRQPHSLIDLLKQVEMVEERIALKASITHQQKSIELQYDDDEPDIEKKIHETDDNCLKSKSLDLQTERFIVTYSVDLVPFYIYDMQFNREMIASTSETLQLFALERIFGVNARLTNGRKAEPRCTDFADFNAESDEETDTFSNVAEPSLADLNAEDMQKLSYYLTDRLKQKSTRHLALYYAHFYWRLRGDTRSALKCLLRHIGDSEEVKAPANFQLASLYIRVGKYHEAADILETVVSEISDCAECHAALGDAYVLAGNFSAAIMAFEEAATTKMGRPETAEAATMKSALLRCVMKVFEVMENRHSTLLGTIDDVNEFKDKSTRLKLLSVFIEANRATPETRLQAKLAYEHFMAGPVPHLNCYGVTQRFLFVFGTSPLFGASSKSASVSLEDRGVERLHCVVDDLGAFNVSLLMRYRELLETAFREKKVLTNEDGGPTRAELFREQLYKFLQETNRQIVEYAKKLSPYMAMDIDTPSYDPKYSSERHNKLPKIYATSTAECRRLLNENGSPTLDAFNLFLSPDNKGYIVSDILTKYLALDAGEMTPLPWHMPTCYKFSATVNKTVDEVLNYESIQKLMNDSSSIYPIGHDDLKQRLLSLPNFNDVELNSDNTKKSNVLLGDLGQRISNLLKYRVGADWISLNLAALYLRYFGLYKDAMICLKIALNLEKPHHKDVTYTQMAQILMRVAENVKDETERHGILEDIIVILKSALKQDNNEPLTHFLMGVAVELREKWKTDSTTDNNENEINSAESVKHFFNALAVEPKFELARRAILRIRCNKMITDKIDEFSTPLRRSIRNENPPLCCWPNEQEVYCFKQPSKSKLRKKRKNSKIVEPEELCYTIENQLEKGMSTNFVYFRCNVVYTGRSYRPPPFARIILPFLKPAEELRRRIKQRFVKLIEDCERDDRARADDVPVLPLDYGGFSEERIRAHQAQLARPSEAELHQSVIILSNKTATADVDDSSSDIDGKLVNEERNIDKKKSNIKDESSVDSVTEKPVFTSTLSTHSATFDDVVDIRDILRYEIPKPRTIPEPLKELVVLGKKSFPPPKHENLREYCKSYKKAHRILEQLTSTYVSVTAKGIHIHDSFTTASAISLSSEEPFCPDVNSEINGLMKELDQLPAFQLRQQLKFYRPETALRDAFQSLGETSAVKATRRMTIDEMATRIAHAMRDSKLRVDEVDWTLSGAASLYWRIKGDALNAIKCLRHSLVHSPDDMKDIALISIANIYHQAGFHHSALDVGGMALRISPDSVVAIHFTLANIYVSISDFTNALAFYYSTLALQSKFDGAKDRIRAIHCETNGKLL